MAGIGRRVGETSSGVAIGSTWAVERRSLSAGAVIGFGSQFVVIGGGLAAQVIVARHLGAADFGAYSLATTLTYLYAVVLRCGLHSLAVRSIAQVSASGAGGARELTWHLVRLSSALTLIAVPFLGFVVLPVSNMLFLSGRLDSVAIWVLAFTISGEAVRFVYSECFRGFNQQGSAAILGNAGRTVAFVAFVVAIVMLDDQSTLLLVLIAALAASLVAAFAAGLILVGWVCKRVQRESKPTVLSARTSLRQGSAFMVTELCAFGLALGDVLVVGVFSDDTEVALYSAASRGAAMLSVPAIVLVGLLSPVVASLWTSRELTALQRILTKTITLAGLLAMVGLVLSIMFGGDVLALLFGEDFGAAGPIVSVLAIGATFIVLFGQGFQLLMLCGRARIATVVIAVFSICTVLAELVAGARWGALGVAVASASGVSAQQFAMAVMAKRLLGLGSYPFAGRSVAMKSE